MSDAPDKIHFNDIFPHYYICGNCAENMQLTWPKGHCATMHEGICLYCNTKQGLCAVSDWRHPRQKHKGPLVWD